MALIQTTSIKLAITIVAATLICGYIGLIAEAAPVDTPSLQTRTIREHSGRIDGKPVTGSIGAQRFCNARQPGTISTIPVRTSADRAQTQ